MGGRQSDIAMGELLDVISTKQEGEIFQILIHSKFSDPCSVLPYLLNCKFPVLSWKRCLKQFLFSTGRRSQLYSGT